MNVIGYKAELETGLAIEVGLETGSKKVIKEQVKYCEITQKTGDDKKSV